jgi:hypothetical protein
MSIIYDSLLLAQAIPNPASIVNTAPDIISELIVKSDALFGGILAACKPLAAIGIGIQLYQMIPKFNDLEELPNNVHNLFWASVLVTFLVTPGLAKNVAIFNWGAIKSIDGAISFNIQQILQIDNLTANLAGDQKAIKDIEKQVNDCKSVPATLGNGVINPAYTNCKTAIQSKINSEIAAGNIKDQNLLDQLGNLALSAITLDIDAFTKQFSQTAGNFSKAVVQAGMDVFFTAWNLDIYVYSRFAILISILALPIPLCLSVFNHAPLMVWFSSFWAVGIYMFNYTILTNSFKYFSAKFSTNASVYFLDIGVCFLAPTLAALMAAGGGIAVYKFADDLVKEAIKTVTNIAIKIVEIAAAIV